MVAPQKAPGENVRPFMALPTHVIAMRTEIDCGSHLERLMGLALLELITDPSEFGSDDYVNFLFRRAEFPFDDMPPITKDMHEGAINILPEASVGAYRLDFALMVKAIGSPAIVAIDLECDGRTYHDRTDAQFVYDRARDRAMSARNIVPLRFSSQEIEENAKACARSAIATSLQVSAFRGRE